MSSVRAFKFDDGPDASLFVLDQLLLPREVKYIKIKDSQDGYDVIRNMTVRGAPCIAAVGCLSLLVELMALDPSESVDKVRHLVEIKSDMLKSSRPTAVNLEYALNRVRGVVNSMSTQRPSDGVTCSDIVNTVAKMCSEALLTSEMLNQKLGDYGASELLQKSSGKKKLNVLTHCNTGSLATAGYGTALGVIRSLAADGSLERAYCTETRPYNQGSRLTAWELVEDDIPTTLIADSMVAHLLSHHQLDGVIVGADRVAANGDTANKIGTYQLAVLCNHFKVPFYVAAPQQTFDIAISRGNEIPIEYRPADEMRRMGNIQLAPSEVEVLNPSFDITPANLITGFITEYGIFQADDIENFMGRLSSSDGLRMPLF